MTLSKSATTYRLLPAASAEASAKAGLPGYKKLTAKDAKGAKKKRKDYSHQLLKF